MSSIRVSIEIPRPIDEVWRELSDLRRHSEWMADAERIEFVGDQTAGPGTTMKVATRVGPLRTMDVIVVNEWVEPTTIAVSHEGLVSGTGAFHLEPVDGRTRFTWSERLSFPWYLGGSITAVFAKPVLRRIWRSNLERFARSIT